MFERNAESTGWRAAVAMIAGGVGVAAMYTVLLAVLLGPMAHAVQQLA